MTPLESWIFLLILVMGLLAFLGGVTAVIKGIETILWRRRVAACERAMRILSGGQRGCAAPEEHRLWRRW